VAVVDQILEAVNLVDQEEALLVTRQGARLHRDKEVMVEEDLVVNLVRLQVVVVEKVQLVQMEVQLMLSLEQVEMVKQILLQDLL
jgi:hypothetical protein